jgi:hypothetical protein
LSNVVAALSADGLAPDCVGYEANMATEADRLLASFTSRRLRLSYEKNMTKRGIVPSSLLTATWYLVRLGILDTEVARPVALSGTEFKPAARLINVLPSGYARVEAEAMQIISATHHAAAANRISAKYFPWVPTPRTNAGQDDEVSETLSSAQA